MPRWLRVSLLSAANGARVWSVWNAIGNLTILTLPGGVSAAATLMLARRAGRALKPGEEPRSAIQARTSIHIHDSREPVRDAPQGHHDDEAIRLRRG